MDVAVIADDLTGAADTGVQFVRAGYRTAVTFRGSPVPPSDEVDVVVVDTDSRALSPEEARERVSEAGEAVRNARIVYKKVDSTLRGPVAAELAAALGATVRHRALVAPAFPGTGRTTQNGMQLLHGVPIHETTLAKDPRTPVRKSHIPSILAEAGLEDVAILGVAEVEDTERVHRVLENARWIVADAETDVHLQTLARTVPSPSQVLWVGSAGLALALGSAYPGPHADETSQSSSAPARSVAVVAGSASEVTHQQLDVLLQKPWVTGVELDPVVAATKSPEEAARGALKAARLALKEGGSIALYLKAGEEVDAALEKASVGERAAERITAALAETAAGLSDEELIDALVLTGGDTAVRVARRLGSEGILLKGELEAGVPIGTLIGPRAYRVITKAGGFGSPETLLKALHAITEPSKE